VSTQLFSGTQESLDNGALGEVRRTVGSIQYTSHGSSRCPMRKLGAITRRRRCSAEQRRPISARYSMIIQALCIKIQQQNSRRFAARQAAASLQHAVQASMREAKSGACRSINDPQETCGCKPTAGARHTGTPVAAGSHERAQQCLPAMSALVAAASLPCTTTRKKARKLALWRCASRRAHFARFAVEQQEAQNIKT